MAVPAWWLWNLHAVHPHLRFFISGGLRGSISWPHFLLALWFLPVSVIRPPWFLTPAFPTMFSLGYKPLPTLISLNVFLWEMEMLSWIGFAHLFDIWDSYHDDVISPISDFKILEGKDEWFYLCLPNPYFSLGMQRRLYVILLIGWVMKHTPGNPDMQLK